MDPMNLKQIEMFRAVMQMGSFTGAAAALHISQPGVSRAARHLETQLGVQLFERTEGRIRPTSEALALAAEIDRSYKGVKAIQEFARSLRQGTYQTLRVGCTPNLSLGIAPRAIAALLAAGPGVRVSLEVFPRGQLMADGLITHQLDVGFASVPMEHPLLATRMLGEWRQGCIFPKDHRFALKRRISASDLRGEALVGLNGDTFQGRALDNWLKEDREWFAPRALARSGQAAASLAACGVGIAFVDNLTEADSRSPGLIWRPLLGSPRFPIWAAWNLHHLPPRQATRLADLVVKEIDKLSRPPPSG